MSTADNTSLHFTGKTSKPSKHSKSSSSEKISYEEAKNSDEPIATTKENEKTALDPTQSKTLGNDAPQAKKAAKEEAKKPVQMIDKDTNPEDLKEMKPGKPVPIILSPEERPMEDVFQNIVNFRDVGGNCNTDSNTKRFKAMNLFRSGRLDDADTADLSLLKEKYNIGCVIDLRSETEGKMGEDLINTFPASAIVEQLRAKELLKVNEDEIDVEPDDIEQKVEQKEIVRPGESKMRITYFINFAGRRFRYYGVWKPLSFSQKIKTVGLVSLGRKAEAVMYIGQHVLQPRGLIGLNKDFIDYCGAEIVQALKLMTHKHNYPLLVHCTQGKDRTGLVIALSLSLCDVSDTDIIKDYERTQKGLARQRDVMVEEMRKTGLDPSFSDAPPAVMQDTLNYIREKFGSILAYLKLHELTDSDIEHIRKNLLRKD